MVGVFLPIEGLPLQHAVPIEQLLMTFHQPAMRVGSFDVEAGFVHIAMTVQGAALDVCPQENTLSGINGGGQRRYQKGATTEDTDEDREGTEQFL